MTVYQAFQNEKVIPIGRECKRSALKLGRRRRTNQNLNLMVNIQTVDLGRRRGRRRDLAVESVLQYTRRENLLKTAMSLDIATPQDCPSRIVEKQHRRNRCGQASFYMPASHS